MEFFSRYKKMLLVLGFMVIVAVVGYALYYMFFSSGPATENPANSQNPTASGSINILPGSGEGPGQTGASSTPGRLNPIGSGQTGAQQTAGNNGVKNSLNNVNEVSPNESVGATANADGSGVQYYSKPDGKFYAISPDGKITVLSDQVFHDVSNVTWAADKTKAILEFPDGAKIAYDFNTKKQTTLPKHWEGFDFSPTGNQIVLKSMGLDPNNRWLAIANNDGSGARTIEQLGENADKVYDAWSPNNQVVAMYTEGTDMNRQEVYFVGQNNENFKSMTIEGRGFQPVWSPTGDRLLYSVYSSDTHMNPSLWIANAEGDQIGTGRTALSVETWADKCSFADATSLYCAVPDNLPDGSGLFPEAAKNTADTLYVIDTRTGSKKIVSTPDGSYNMSNIVVSGDQSTLYFTDTNTNKIYKINLK